MEGKGCSAMPSSCGTEQKKEGSCGSGQKKGDCGGGGKPSCIDTIVKGAFAGAIVMFIYISASWMLLPWHMKTMHAFKNEKAVAASLLQNAPENGIYVLPYTAGPDQKPAVDKPYAFVSVVAGGYDTAGKMKAQMLREFVLCLLASALLTCILKKQSCGCPVAFSMKIGVLVALAHNVPNALWFHFPHNYTLVGMADDVIAFTLAGAAISRLVLKCSKSGGACPGCGCNPCKCGSGGSCGTKTGGCG
jgi:hypothetical protein